MGDEVVFHPSVNTFTSTFSKQAVHSAPMFIPTPPPPQPTVFTPTSQEFAPTTFMSTASQGFTPNR